MKKAFKITAAVLAAVMLASCGIEQSYVIDPEIEQYIGEYKFEESAETGFYMCYDLEIYREKDGYYADYSQNGRMTWLELKAEVIKSEKGIALKVLEYEDDCTSRFLEIGDVFLELEKEGTQVHTYWKKGITLIEENQHRTDCFYYVGNESDLLDIDDVDGIGEEAAIRLCCNILGENDETTGFAFNFHCIGAVELNGNKYYVIDHGWIVDNSHLSHIGAILVNVDGSSVYEGIEQYDGQTNAITYSLGEMWKD